MKKWILSTSKICASCSSSYGFHQASVKRLPLLAIHSSSQHTPSLIKRNMLLWSELPCVMAAYLRISLCFCVCVCVWVYRGGHSKGILFDIHWNISKFNSKYRHTNVRARTHTHTHTHTSLVSLQAWLFSCLSLPIQLSGSDLLLLV